MEVSWFGRHFTAEQQAGEGAGWIVVTSPDQSPTSLLNTGRRTQQMCLQCRERRIAVHPMSQVLEEEPWRQQIANAIGLDQEPQYLLRVGYVDGYPEPVSMRRPVDRFTKLA
jgi:hypothetical protein